jgi:hypothetical protein
MLDEQGQYVTKRHILVDFDHTLAEYTTWADQGSAIGPPVPAMVERVKRWLRAGEDVRIFTARATDDNPRLTEDVSAIQAWCVEVFGHTLDVTNRKNFGAVAIWDNIAVTVEPNTGWNLTERSELPDPLTVNEEIDLFYKGSRKHA